MEKTAETKAIEWWLTLNFEEKFEKATKYFNNDINVNTLSNFDIICLHDNSQ